LDFHRVLSPLNFLLISSSLYIVRLVTLGKYLKWNEVFILFILIPCLYFSLCFSSIVVTLYHLVYMVANRCATPAWKRYSIVITNKMPEFVFRECLLSFDFGFLSFIAMCLIAYGVHPLRSQRWWVAAPWVPQRWERLHFLSRKNESSHWQYST
jgi:hypothetical protein